MGPQPPQFVEGHWIAPSTAEIPTVSTFCKAQKRRKTDHLGATAAIRAYGIATASERGCLEKMIPFVGLLRFTV